MAAQAPEVPDPGEIFQVEGDIYIAKIENRNTVVLLSDERVLISETNFTRNAETLAGLIASVTDAPVELVVTTHWLASIRAATPILPNTAPRSWRMKTRAFG